MSDFSVMTAAGAVFTAGPPVVKESLGEDDHQGGPRRVRRWRCRAGSCTTSAPDDAAALDVLRHYLGYFPSQRLVLPARIATAGDQGVPPTDELLEIVPARQPPCLRHARRARRGLRRRLRGSRCSPASGRADHLRPRPPRRRSGRRRRQPAPGAGRLDRRPTPRTRRRTSSWSPTPSTCRWCSWPTTRACCPGRPRSGAGCCAAEPACSLPRPRRPAPSCTSPCARPTGSARW